LTLPALLGSIVTDYTMRTVAAGSLALGLVSGALGSFAVLRRQSLLGDAISHAALPGVAVAFLLTRSKEPIVLLLGAGVAGWLGMLAVLAVTNTTRLKQDSALGIVLSVFFGLGLVLLTFIQKIPTASQSGLDKFLFGQAATLLERDVVTIATAGGLAVVAMLLLWKELKVLSFDPDFAATVGLPARGLEVFLTLLLVTAIVIGLQAVGVVLMSAMVVAPAAAARQWTDRLGRMVALSAFFGGTAGVVGTILSGTSQRLPTGPLIVLVAGSFVILSLLFAPARGILWRWLRHVRSRRHVHADSVLVDLFALARQHGLPGRAHAEASLRAMRPWRGAVGASLKQLAAEGYVRRQGEGWVLTPAGWDEASGLVSGLTEVEP
jgi:manganese/zinc/iron transport system permease protein